MNGKIIFTVDDDVRIAELVRALAQGGLALSNVDGHHLRVHRAETLANVIDLTARRRREAETDAQIRAGMRHLATHPTDDPGAA